jgi:hypothetical protein
MACLCISLLVTCHEYVQQSVFLSFDFFYMNQKNNKKKSLRGVSAQEGPPHPLWGKRFWATQLQGVYTRQVSGRTAMIVVVVVVYSVGQSGKDADMIDFQTHHCLLRGAGLKPLAPVPSFGDSG